MTQIRSYGGWVQGWRRGYREKEHWRKGQTDRQTTRQTDRHRQRKRGRCGDALSLVGGAAVADAGLLCGGEPLGARCDGHGRDARGAREHARAHAHLLPEPQHTLECQNKTKNRTSCVKTPNAMERDSERDGLGVDLVGALGRLRTHGGCGHAAGGADLLVGGVEEEFFAERDKRLVVELDDVPFLLAHKTARVSTSHNRADRTRSTRSRPQAKCSMQHSGVASRPEDIVNVCETEIEKTKKERFETEREANTRGFESGSVPGPGPGRCGRSSRGLRRGP